MILYYIILDSSEFFRVNRVKKGLESPRRPKIGSYFNSGLEKPPPLPSLSGPVHKLTDA